MKFIGLLPLIFLFTDACVEPLRVDLIETNRQLVVDGLITNDPGPYQVKLFYSSGLDSTLRRPAFESGAMVWIISDSNESGKLVETEPGTYQTNPKGIQGTIGTGYKLKIVTSNGKVYETSYQKLYPSGLLDSVFVSFEYQAISSDNSPDFKDALKLLINGRGVSGEPNLLRWRWKSVNEVKSFPELRTENIKGVFFADPEPCSGYVKRGEKPKVGEISKIRECTCCVCWSTRYSNGTVISKNDYLQNSEYNKVGVGELAINSMLFYDRLYIEVEQLSLSEEVYNFWKLVEAQQKATGNLFQPNAIKIHGNVYSVLDSNEEVLGIFAVSSIVRKAIFVDQSVIPYTLPPIDVIPHDCRDSFLNATTEKPPFW